MEILDFSVIDYVLFVIMLTFSVAVGIYYGCFGNKQETTKDYLHGGKNMKVFPVGMSLVASTLSASSLLGVPAEVYMFGTQYWMMIFSICLLGIFVNFIYLPVFYKLQPTSIFEYLEMRFDKNIRRIISIIRTFSNLINLPILIYAPSLAFNQITGFNLYAIATIMSLICIFYTTIGGIKAVVWNDTLQFCITLCTLAAVLVMGVISVGGITNVWTKSQFGDRLEFFNMDLNPTLRSTFWSVVIGNLLFWTSFIGTSQGTVQRFLSVPTFGDATKILLVFIIFTVITKSISCFSGLIMYAKYYDCDPLMSGQISKPDQILPYYVVDVAKEIPGLVGLFVAGLFSTALSSLSTHLNAMAGLVYQDLIAPFMGADTSERKASNIMKFLTLLIGLISVSLVFVVEKLGTILQMVFSLAGITAGPVFGLFTMGMMFPVANSKGALCGFLLSVALMLFIIVENQYLIMSGAIKAIPKPLYIFGCNLNTTLIFNITSPAETTTICNEAPTVEPLWLFRISFYYYHLIGTLMCLIIGLAISLATRNKKDQAINSDLFSPCIQRVMKMSPVVQPEIQETIN